MAQELSDKIRAAAIAKGIDPDLAVSIAQAESSLRPDVSAKTSSAKGLFGIIDKTWSAFGGKPGQQKDADENIRVGMDIIASNTGYLKKKLGRSPQPSEVYAAHFFGPTGAMAFLSADPSTPSESVFSQKVLNANPQLQGKTTQQIRGMLSKKVGEGSTAVASSAPAAPVRASSIRASATPLEHPMLSALGPNYQAAMAVSMLADEAEAEGKSERDDSESEKMMKEFMAEPARPVALASADLSHQSPFPVIAPVSTASAKQQLQSFSHGGPVHRAGGSPDTGEQLTPQQIEQLAQNSQASREYNQNMLEAPLRSSTYSGLAKGFTQNVVPNLVGMPVDLVTMAMRPFGYKVEKPVLGSEWNKEFLTDNGLRPAPPQEGTAERDFYDVGNFGSFFVNPAATTRKLATTGEKLVQKGEQAIETGKKMAQTAQVGAELGVEKVKKGAQKAKDMLTELKKPKEVPQVARIEPTMTPPVETELARMTEQRGLPRNAAQAPDPLMGVRPTVEEAQANVAAQQAEPLPAPPAEVNVPPQMMVPEVAPVAAPMEATAEVIRPFAGRLDAFIDTIRNPVQLGQLKGQLRGKFRDYDLERVERAFPGMDDKTKLTPDQIKQALAGTHSPSRIIAETLPPTPGKHWQNADNVWGAPLGTTNLYLDQPPEKIALSKLHDEGVLAFGRLTPDSVQYPRLEDVEKTRQFLNREDVAKVIDPEVINSVNQKLDRAQQNIGLIDQYSNDIRNIAHGFTSPVLYKNAEVAQGAHNNQPWFRFVREMREANSQAEIEKFVSQGMTQSEALMEYSRLVSNQEYGKNLAAQADTYAAKKVHELAAADAAKHGIPSPDFSLINWEAHKADVAGAARNTPEFRVSVENVMEPSIQTVHEATKNVKRFLKDDLSKVEQTLFKNRLYEGKHLGVAGRPYPISFTRFSEHAADIPGMGTVQGRHFHELQSDLYNAVTKEGSAYGSLAKDQEELARLNNELRKNTEKALQQKQEWASQAGSQTTPAEHSNKMREIDKNLTNLNNPLNDRIKIVNRRIIGNAKYNLEEPFANYETSSDVRRQMLIKGAVHSAMKDGKSFATFPGAESTQPQLYVDMETGRSKVYPNLKQVVKDLGGEKAGFDVRPIELPPNKNGKPVTAWGITWSPESAARIVEKGVPFAKGGSVERLSADNRRYL